MLLLPDRNDRRFWFTSVRKLFVRWMDDFMDPNHDACAGFQLHSASTSWGISRTATATKAGIMITSSNCPRTGIKSGIRSIGDAR